MQIAPLVPRPARVTDLDAILAIERGPGYESLVGRSTREEHEAMLAGPRHAYFVGERDEIEAFAILRDLDDVNGNVYLKRIATARPGQRTGSAFFAALIDGPSRTRARIVSISIASTTIFAPRRLTPNWASRATAWLARPISGPTVGAATSS